MSEETLLTFAEAVEVARCSRRTLQRAMTNRELNYIQRGPRGRILFKREHLERWWARNTQTTRRGA